MSLRNICEGVASLRICLAVILKLCLLNNCNGETMKTTSESDTVMFNSIFFNSEVFLQYFHKY